MSSSAVQTMADPHRAERCRSRRGHDRGGVGEQDHAAGALRYLIGAPGPNGNMTLETLLGVLRAMGVRLSVSG